MLTHPLPETDLRSVVERLAPMAEALRGARIFVTGGTGFFGRWMLESLLSADDALGLGATVTVLARHPGRLPFHLAVDPRVAFVAGDVRHFEFPDGGFTHVLHLATDSTLAPTPENADLAIDTLVNGTRRVLRFAAERGVAKFLFASSGAVYGPQPIEFDRMPESYSGAPDLFQPISPYAEGKRVAEILVANAAGFDATLARGFAFVGPGLPLDAHFAVGNFLRDALAGRPIEIRGDASAVRSYLYAADLAAWLWTILLRGEAARPYNVGSERAVTIRELASRIADLGGTEVRTAAVATARPTSHRYVPSTLRARTELGLEETVSLDDALRRTARYAQIKEALHA